MGENAENAYNDVVEKRPLLENLFFQMKLLKYGWRDRR
jgi:hypothetical protein